MNHSQSRYVIYSCLVNDYDYILPPVKIFAGFDFILFTDSNVSVNGWEVRKIDESITHLPPNLINRFYKLFPHKFFESYHTSIYIDANVRITKNPLCLLDSMFLARKDICLMFHSKRKTIQEEYKVLSDRKKLTFIENLLIKNQIKIYKNKYDLDKLILTENNVIIRRHSNEVIKIMEFWWKQILFFSERDQISLPYVIKALRYKPLYLNFSPFKRNNFFKVVPHKRKCSLLVAKKYHSLVWFAFSKIQSFFKKINFRL